MFQFIEDFSIAAWTPEIGGIFQGMKLKVKPFLKVEKNRVFMAGLYRKHKMSATDFIGAYMHPEINAAVTDKSISLIEDWEGCELNGEKIPCTNENKEKYLRPLADDLTGQPIDKENPDKGFHTLLNYLNEFTETIENFQKNFEGTVSGGKPGGEIGPGNKRNSPAT